MIEVLTLRNDDEEITGVTIWAPGFESTLTIPIEDLKKKIASNKSFKSIAGKIDDATAESCRQELSKWA